MPSNDFDGFIKEQYSEGSDLMNYNQNLNSPFFKTIKKLKGAKASLDGSFAPATMSGNERGGAIAKGESFSTPGAIKSIKPKILTKTLVYPVEVDKKDIELSRDRETSYAELYHVALTDTMARGLADRERQVCGIGTGQITLANGAGSAATALIVDNSLPFREEMYIDIWSALGGTKRTASTGPVRITAVNHDTKTLTLEVAVTWSDNDIVCKENKLTGVTGIDDAKEMVGIEGLVDTTDYSSTFETVSTSTYPGWKAQVIDASSAPISQDLLQRLHNRLATLAGTAPDQLISNHGQTRTFLNTELNKTRYAPGEVKGGVATELKWGKLTWLAYHTIQPGTLYMMNSNEYGRVETRDMHVTDAQGVNVYQMSQQHALGTYYEYEGNLGTFARFKNGKIKTLQEPTL